jgi:hypothetical protein
MPPKNIRRATAESRAAVSIIRGAKPSWQRGQTRLTFGWEIGNFIAASALAPRVSFLSTAEAAALDDEPACYRIGRPICSHKIQFNFLNGNLMVPAGRQFIFNAQPSDAHRKGQITAPRSADFIRRKMRAARFRLARFRLARFRLARFRLARFRLARFRLEWQGASWCGRRNNGGRHAPLFDLAPDAHI